MNRTDYYIKTAHEEARHHLPHAVTLVELTRSRRVLGSAINTREEVMGKPLYVIELSRAHLEHDSHEEIMDTIRHEIAHLIAGFENGHNDKWKAACKITGANPEQFARAESFNRFKWVAHCPSCERTMGGWFRKPTVQRYCVDCNVNIELVQQY